MNGLTPEATAELRRKLELKRDQHRTLGASLVYGDVAAGHNAASNTIDHALALLAEAEAASAKDDTLSRYCDHCGQTNYDTKEPTS
jgi:hypothetical protein